MVFVARAMWIYADLIVALGVAVAFGTFVSIAGGGSGVLIMPLFALAALIYLCGTVVAVPVQLSFKRWELAAASVTKIIVLIAVLLSCVRIGDYVHLVLFYPAYRQQIAAQAAGSVTPVRFDWGDKAIFVTDGSEDETLVYDPTDALALVDEVRPSDHQFFQVRTRHLVGHFYLEIESST